MVTEERDELKKLYDELRKKRQAHHLTHPSIIFVKSNLMLGKLFFSLMVAQYVDFFFLRLKVGCGKFSLAGLMISSKDKKSGCGGLIDCP